MKKIRLEMKLRNNMLYNLIFLNYSGISDFCRKSSIASPSLIGEYLNLKRSPVKKSGEYSKTLIDLCNWFKVLPEDIFPLDIYNIKNTFHVEEISIQSLPDARKKMLSYECNYDEELDKKEVKIKIHNMIETLPNNREKDIIRKRSGINCNKMTYQEISEIYGISENRTREVGKRAERRLRHPSRSIELKPYHEMYA